ncbi:nucleotide disphospho-sugar-binding domain-containing protein [Streptomyces sp. NPDC090127]|uniref:nucleotide disphospho-sugar-binding domain-containing protein n=1 Tax=Streptomyces sp. NPDC090127 TaxID=3365953 RepID=UPI00380612D2
MRVLLTVLPAKAHVHAVVPLARALQGAGHEVRVASTHPDATRPILAAGLTAVPLGDEDYFPPMRVDEEKLDLITERLALGVEDGAVWREFRSIVMPPMSIFYPVAGLAEDADAEPPSLVDRLVGFATQWRPDLILWDPTWLAGPVAARVSGAAHARLMWGEDYFGWVKDRFDERPELAEQGLRDPLVEMAEPVAARYGLTVDDELLLGQWTVDPIPPGMRLPTSTRTVSVQALPYGGADVLPEWLYGPPERPRVALTLGTTSRDYEFGADEQARLVATMLEVAGGLDVEVVAALNSRQLAGQRVPDNFRVVDYVPYTALLPTCSAVIHHGGYGISAAAAAFGVPQLLLLQDHNWWHSRSTARYVTERGAGLALDPANSTVADMRGQLLRVLREPGFRAGAESVRRDLLATPTPNDIVPQLERLTAEHTK